MGILVTVSCMMCVTGGQNQGAVLYSQCGLYMHLVHVCTVYISTHVLHFKDSSRVTGNDSTILQTKVVYMYMYMYVMLILNSMNFVLQIVTFV